MNCRNNSKVHAFFPLLLLLVPVLGSPSVSGESVYQPLHQYSFPIDSGDERYYTTIQSDCGEMGDGPEYSASQQAGALYLRTRTVGGATSWVGFWHSTNGREVDSTLTLNPQAPLPWPIKPAYQPQIAGLYAKVKGTGQWKIELKQPDETIIQTWGPNTVNESNFITVTQSLSAPAEAFKLVNIVAETNSDIWFDEIGFVLDMPSMSNLEYAFLTSSCQVFRCYDRDTDYVRDKSYQPVRKAPGEPLSYVFDSVPGLGFAALTAACASHAGMVETVDAIEVAQQTITNLLTIANNGVAHTSGFLPHWITLDEDGETVSRHPDSEYSTVDTALAYLSAYLAADMLGLTAERNALLSEIQSLDFDAAALPDNQLSHGFGVDGALLEYSWINWGSETGLLMILSKLADPGKTWSYCPTPPVFRGRGFIQELLPLLFSRFGLDTGGDANGVDWRQARMRLLSEQRAVLDLPAFIGGFSSCEIISADGDQRYYEGGSNPPALGGILEMPGRRLVDFGQPWVAPHYAAMASVLDVSAAETQIAYMRAHGLMYPMCGPVESVLMDKSTWLPRRPHYKQVALNGWFSAIGYYHALVAQRVDLDDSLYAITNPTDPAYDATLGAAVQAYWNDVPEPSACPPGVPVRWSWALIVFVIAVPVTVLMATVIKRPER